MTEVIALDPQVERQLATDLFNHVWRLLELPERSPEQIDDMLHSAHASRWHWGRVGSAQHWAIGEWQCSRVNAVLGRGDAALAHARRCLELTERHPMDDFVAASAHEALARAHAVLGDRERAVEERNISYGLALALEDDDDRAVIEADLGTLPI